MAKVSFELKKLHHVAIPVYDFEAMQRFYVEILGFEAHADKPNWLRAGDGFNVHLMPSSDRPGPARIEQHFALQVTSLHDLVIYLLGIELKPFQSSLDGKRHEITEPDDTLDFGIGSIFIMDPENNTIEFLEANKGLFAMITD